MRVVGCYSIHMETTIIINQYLGEDVTIAGVRCTFDVSTSARGRFAYRAWAKHRDRLVDHLIQSGHFVQVRA